MNFRLLLAVTIIIVTGCNSKNEKPANDSGNMYADTLAANITMLASDSFMGRKPFTDGETKTIRFLEDKFREVGLEPGNGSSFLQKVPMVRITTTAAPSMKVTSGKGDFDLKGREDYVIWTDKTDSVLSLDKTEVVFAGYGVVAPEHNWNDYANIDVKGKVVLILVNDPGFNAGDSTLFKGKSMTWYGRWTYKFQEAARQGAKGCLIVHNTIAASYPFTVVQNSWNTSKLRLDNRGKTEKLCDVIGWVSSDAAKKLLAASGNDTTLLASADARGFKGVPLNIGLSTSLTAQTNYDVTNNVLGKITGSKYPDETIIYTAHWDHLGVGAPDETGDSIYNGALDNASGTAGLIELARAFKKSPNAPERTIIFLSVTAEEQGLWGSEYYAQYPIYPINKTVANINMDGLNFYGKTKDVIVIGEGQSDLEDILKEEVQKTNRVISFDVHPEAGSYYRSDHFNFAKVGIPALYIKSGVEVEGKAAGYGKTLKDNYTDKNYHRPSDEYPVTSYTFIGAIDDLQLLFRVGQRIANSRSWPEWKSGSEFRTIREKNPHP